MKNKNSNIKRFEKIKMSFPKFVIGDLPHANLKAGDPRRKPSGMTSVFREETPDRSTRGTMERGFTLIELLVVVLIIGILASIALPQYQKAVWKARFSEVLTTASSLDKAVKLYNLSYDGSRNQETLTADDLDINAFANLSLTTIGGEVYYCSKYACYQVRCHRNYCAWYGRIFERENQQNLLAEIGFDVTANYKWQHFCFYEPETSGTDLGQILCEQARHLGWEDVEEGF